MKKIISVVLALMMLSAITFVSADSGYIASDWAKEELIKAEEVKLIPESLQDKDLTEKITRAEFAAVSVKLYENLAKENAEVITQNPFSDTEDAEVLKAYNLGITLGTGENTFSPDNTLTREEAATMLTRVYKKIAFAGRTIDKDENSKLNYDASEKFTDDENISDWAKASVYFMVSNGIIKGVGENKFAPKNITEEEKLSGYANTTREQAIIMAVRMSEMKIVTGTLDSENPDPYAAMGQNPEKSDDENTYTIAFIGGSLTEGGAEWINATKKIFTEKMPDKSIVTINAGKGGTGSSMGAVRFMEDVGKYSPDVVFIEFAVNDTGASEQDCTVWMESMLRQCQKLSKVPVVVFLQTPQPTEIGSDLYNRWITGVKLKEKIAEHYGIKSINIYNYMQEDFENTKEEKGYETFTDYLSKYYQKSGEGFNVHGGYSKYSEAIKKAFAEDYEGCMQQPKNTSIYCQKDKKLVEAAYSYIPVNSGRIYYTGKWNTYTADNPFETDDDNMTISEKHYGYPFFTKGIKQTTSHAAFGFFTKAEAFCLDYPASSAGSTAKVYIDGKEAGTLSCHSIYSGVNYMTNFIELPNDGKEHKVILDVAQPNATNYVFRFGHVIERK